MAIEIFQREEIKFLLTDEQYRKLLPELEQYMNPDPFCIGGKDYGIYNIYYDTPDDHLIRASLSKPYYKEKIRLRSYMSPAKEDDLVFLEIKKKIGGIVNKRRITLTLEEAEAYMQKGTHPSDNGKYIRRV
ncbi:MAG: VTC domain-containing protein, partial [Ruminococcus sp.]